MNEDKNNKDKKNKVLGEMDKACGQSVFPTEIAEVDGFIAGILERYGESTGDSLFRNAAADLLGAVVTFVLDYLPDEYHTAGHAIEQLPYLKPSPLSRNSDGMRPSDRVSFGLRRGFLPDEDETLNRYCRFIALVPNANMRMSVRYTALALLKYSFPNDTLKRSRHSIRKIIDDLG